MTNCIMRGCLTFALLLVVFVVPSGLRAERVGAYDFPFVDPLVATVVATPLANRVELPDIELGREAQSFRVQPLPDREVPPVFFFERFGAEFGLLAQDGPAPLVFVIAGTGGSFEADINKNLAILRWDAGNHVISLPNQTHANFVINASTTGVPGRLRDDAVDMHRLMRVALARVEDRIEVTEVHLTGYSLGATLAAFVAKYDDEQAAAGDTAFGFERVLLLNPSVSLYTSIQLVDDMLDRFVETDPEAIPAFLDRAFTAFANLYAEGGLTDFAGDFVYRIYTVLEPDAVDIEKLIGIAFRLSAVNLAFAADVMSDSGFLTPAGTQLRATDRRLTDIYRDARERSFVDYFEGLYQPFFQRAEPGLTREQMIEDASLRSIESYLATAEHVGFLGNEDDIILVAEDWDFLDRVFEGRATVYPIGGHCGNYMQRDVAARIVDYFATGWRAAGAATTAARGDGS
jgi:hypothetical protein